MAVLVIQCLLWLVIAFKRVVDRRVFGPDGECMACGYSLAGLEAGTVCPECGAETGFQQRVVESVRYPFTPGRLSLAVFAVPAAIAYAFWVDACAAKLATFSYQVQGYQLSVATTAAAVRDLRNGGDAVLMPLGPVLALCPVLALIPSRRYAAGAFAVCVVGSALWAVGRWVLPYLH